MTREVKSLVKAISKHAADPDSFEIYEPNEKVVIEKIIVMAIARGHKLIELCTKAKGMGPLLDWY